MAKTEDIVLGLISVALGNAETINVSSNTNWKEVIDIASAQGVLGLCFDGIEKVPSNQRPDTNILLQWFGQVSYMENLYDKHYGVICELGQFYANHNFRMMLLKGYGLSLYWPNPKHRPTGDIDIYLYGKWKEADNLLHGELGIDIENGHHHHSVFQYKGQSVENHYDFINIHSHSSSKKIEGKFKKLVEKAGIEILPNIQIPCPMLNALFIIRHAAGDFAAGHTTLKQILDWSLMVKASHQDIDWSAFWNDVEVMGMKHFVLSIIGIAVKYLGFNISIFQLPKNFLYDDELVERVLYDTLHPDYIEERPKGYILYIKWMFSRWWAHRWKHKIVYSDSLISTFINQSKAHLMKPATLRN